MGNLFSYVFSQLGFFHREASVILVGLDNAGKTSLLRRLTEGTFSKYPPTERAYKKEYIYAGVTFRAWDIGGHEAVRHLWREFIPQSSAVIFVVDSADQTRISEVRDELEDLLELDVIRTNNIAIAIMLNKTDLESAVGISELYEALEIDELLEQTVSHTDSEKEFRLRVFPCSVLKNEGLECAFKWLADTI
eukprot:GSMAST32.ASY1.ANO1.1519.1 assembled CDS